MSHRRRIVVLLACLFCTPMSLRADTVKLVGKPEFRNVTIKDFKHGKLIFRGVSRQLLRKPLAQIAWIAIDKAPALSAAERHAAAGQWSQAVQRYDQALRASEERWTLGLIRIRLLVACDRAGQFARAVRLYVELVTGEGTSMASCAPRHVAPTGSPVNLTARRHIERALDSSRSVAETTLLRTLLLEVMIADDTADFDNVFPPRPAVGTLASAALRLPESSFVASAASAALAANRPERAVRILERGLAHVEEARRPAWRLLLGRGRLAAGDPVGAAAEFMLVEAARPDPALAAEAVYYSAVAHERMDRVDVAIELYQELIGRENTPAEWKHKAGLSIKRLGE